MKTYLLTVALLITAQTALTAGNPNTIFIKNTGSEPAHIWVNGYYQGFLRPGETRYSISDGFITQDSGTGKDGRPVKESHGGWEQRDTPTVTFQAGTAKQQTMNVSFDGRGEAAIGIASKDANPILPATLDRETASPIIKGSKPHLHKTTTAEPKTDPAAAKYIRIWRSKYSPTFLEIKGDGTYRYKQEGAQERTGTWKTNSKEIKGIELSGTFSINGQPADGEAFIKPWDSKVLSFLGADFE